MDPTLLIPFSFFVGLLAVGHNSPWLIFEGIVTGLLLTLWGYLLYKSKPTVDSFVDFKKNFEKYLTMQMTVNADDQKKESDPWYERCVRFVFTRVVAKLMVKITMNDPVIFNVGLFMVAYMPISIPFVHDGKQDNKQRIVIFWGICGAWIPISQMY